MLLSSFFKKLKYRFNPNFKIDKFFVFAVLFIILNIIDMVLTSIALQNGLHEANPVMRFSFSFVLKIVGVISVIWLLHKVNQKVENQKFLSCGINLIYGIYSLVILNNLYQIWKVI